MTVATRIPDEVIAALPTLDSSPRDVGTLCLVVRRPGVDEREILAEGELDLTEGLVGDNWAGGQPSRVPSARGQQGRPSRTTD